MANPLAWATLVLLSLTSITVCLAQTQSVPPGFGVLNPSSATKGSSTYTCQDSNGNYTTCVATCPSKCSRKCIVSCPDCRTLCFCDLFPGTVCGDPRFTGGDGNVFYFHGHKNENFCLLADIDLHINAHFIGKRNPDLNRDFTWVQALGIIFGEYHRLYIGAEKTMTWNDEVDRLKITFNDKVVYIPAETNGRWMSDSAPELIITRTASSNGVIVELRGMFTIMANVVPITKEDSMIHNYGVGPDDSLAHLDLSFKFLSLSDTVNGVLGQTYSPDYVNKLDITKKMPVMGGSPKFLSSGLFSIDCEVAQFGKKSDSKIEMSTGLQSV